MSSSNYRSLIGVIAFSALALGGCNNSSEDTTKKTTTEKATEQVTTPAVKGINLAMFAKGSFTQEPKIVDCETAEGTKTTCYQFITAGAPAGRTPGPFCPRTTSDGADVGGAWFSKEGSGDLVDITGEFILKLSEYYGDEK